VKLSEGARAYLTQVFEAQGWQGLLYEGKWERTMAKLARLNRLVTGAAGLGLFSCLNLAEQREYLAKEFPRRAFALTVSLLGNAGVFNSLLYKGHFPKKNIPGSFYRFYADVFERLFTRTLARENFFLQIIFHGKVVFREGCPIECEPWVYAKAKRALEETELCYVQGNVVEQAARAEPKVAFLSLSDVPSYFSGDTERQFLQRVRGGLAPKGLVVVRSYLRVPEQTDATGFLDVSASHQELMDQEKVQVYLVQLYERASAP
jgi:S-adenosylmethionine-diacylglycerol 3-amino-3-carboxypropyl transferase